MPPQQQPYGTPYPQQQPYGWGVPPVAPPPKRRPLVVILAVVGGLVALGVAGSVMRGVEESSGAGYPDAEYTLGLPKTLVDGRYELDEDLSDSADAKEIEKEADGAWGYKDLKAVLAQYSPAGDKEKATLVVSGMYGRFKYPGRMREDVMKGGAAEGSRVAIPAKDFHPAGAGGITVSCEVLTNEQATKKVTVPMCGWGDGNTGGAVAEIITAKMSQDPAEVDLGELAKVTAQIRTEMRKPIG